MNQDEPRYELLFELQMFLFIL